MIGFSLLVSFCSMFLFVNFSSGQEDVVNDLNKSAARFNKVVFNDNVDLEGLERVLESKKNQIKSSNSAVRVSKIIVFPKGTTLSDFSFDPDENELLYKDGSVIRQFRNKDYATAKLVDLFNSNEEGLVWLELRITYYKYEDENGKAIPTRPASGAFKVTEKIREAYFITDMKYLEVDDNFNIVKLPPFVTEVGLSVLNGSYETMDLRKFGGFTSTVRRHAIDIYDKDRKMYAIEDCWKNGKLLCKKGEVIGYYDPLFREDETWP